MRFTVTSVNIEQDSGTEYDTAVDLVHWNSIERTIDMQLEGSTLLLQLTETQTQKSHSCLEPDFDHMERTGETVYVSIDAPDTGERSRTFRAVAWGTQRCPRMEEADWEAYFLHWKLKSPGAHAVSLRQEDAFLDLEGIRENRGPERGRVMVFSEKQAQDWLESLPRLRVGGHAELDLGSEAENMLRCLQQEEAERVAQNNQNQVYNRITENAWRARQAIQAHVEQARRCRAP